MVHNQRINDHFHSWTVRAWLSLARISKAGRVKNLYSFISGYPFFLLELAGLWTAVLPCDQAAEAFSSFIDSYFLICVIQILFLGKRIRSLLASNPSPAIQCTTTNNEARTFTFIFPPLVFISQLTRTQKEGVTITQTSDPWGTAFKSKSKISFPSLFHIVS